jgi:hypothetical protein
MERPPGLAHVSLLLVELALAMVCGGLRAQEVSTSGVTFFETKIRPVLAARCYKCHGPTKQKSDLRLDHISFLLKGGERGPALVPGKPERSRILSAISYHQEDLQMPPKGQLPTSDIKSLRIWVTMGAPWPNEPVPDAGVKTKIFDLQERRQSHWSWRPLQRPQPPMVSDPRWRRQAIDRFVLQRVLEHGLQPAKPADRITLLRRVTFDLTGLPPSLDEQNAFLSDHSNHAYANLVDRLLASKRFGEHWGRHWLDLVRYADSLGHEFDYKIPNAHQYRDYVIRAFNADVPYDQLVREHIAGDLITDPRRDSDGNNESIVGTGFYWLVEQTHAPVDVRKHQSDRRDNQIDVLTKTFLGLTVSCARCHDHKFDAISTADYYALSGYLKSSRFAQVDSSPTISSDLAANFSKASQDFANAWLQQLDKAEQKVAQPLLAAIRSPLPLAAKKKAPKKGAKPPKEDTSPKGRWQKTLADPAVGRDRLHPLHGFHLLQKHPGADIRKHWQPAGTSLNDFAKTGAVAFADFRTEDYSNWFVEGKAFGSGPSKKPLFLRQRDGKPLVQDSGWAFSGGHGSHAQGVLRSQTFNIDKRYLHFFGFGRETRVRVVLEGFNIIRDPIYGQLHQLINADSPRWYTIDLSMWKGRQAFLAFVDQRTAGLADPSRGGGYPADGYLGVQQVWFSDSRTLPEPKRTYPSWILGTGKAAINTADKLSRRYVIAIREAGRALRKGNLQYHHAHLLNQLWSRDLLSSDSKKIQALQTSLAAADAKIGAGRYSLGMVDGTGENEHIYIRGEHGALGDAVPRRLLEALGGKTNPKLETTDGSGRLRLAEQIVAADNPYAARVIVNRLWHHLLGQGIVRTVDNFGVLGEKPSHPLLLDWLANRFVADGWSIKKSIRHIVLSETYQQSSSHTEAAKNNDPSNTYLSHASVRRITSESIRDSILATSGRLDTKMFGPGIPVYIDAFTEGRGRPGQGPIDGHGRRSIYMKVTRNFLSSFLLAFDQPRPAQTQGRRNITNVPAQALAMLNDPFVKAEAKRWADRILALSSDTKARIDHIYRQGLARSPAADEILAVEQFLERQRQIYKAKIDDPRPWRDLCHSIFNVKEFILLR